MPTIKSLDEAAELSGVPRRTLQRWLNEGKLTPWTIEGDRRRFVDLDEIKALREPRPEPRPAGQPLIRPAASGGAPDAAPRGDQVAPPPPLALALIVRDGLLLMTRRRFQEQVIGAMLDWNLVTGSVETGETPEEAAVREVAEEVGLLVVAKERVLEQVHPRSPDKRLFVYIGCEVVSGDADLVDHEENREVRWCTLEEADEFVAPYGGFAAPVRDYISARMVATAAG